MSADTTTHAHRCHCGVSWSCSKPDCQFEDECTDCERAIFETYAEQHQWTVSRPMLSELAHAMRVAKDELMNINDSFPSAYLKASDLGTAQPVVTIDRVEHEPVGREREMKAVLYFEDKEKGVVLNKTNAKKITDLVGSPETDDWIGFKIRLFATTTEFGGETVECIRVKAVGVTGKPAPARAPEPPPVEATDDDIPF